MIEHFADPAGGFFTTSDDHERLVARPKDIEDHPIPSGNSSAALGLLRLSALTGEASYERHAVGLFELLARRGRHATPRPSGTCCRRLQLYLSPRRELAIVGDRSSRWWRSRAASCGRIWCSPRAGRATSGRGSDPAAGATASRVDGSATAYVCENFACRLPVTSPAELERAARSGLIPT